MKIQLWNLNNRFLALTLHYVLLCCNIRAADPGSDYPDPDSNLQGKKSDPDQPAFTLHIVLISESCGSKLKITGSGFNPSEKKTGSFPKITIHSGLLCCNIRAVNPGLDYPDPSLQKPEYKFDHPKNLFRIHPFIMPFFAVISRLRIRF